MLPGGPPSATGPRAVLDTSALMSAQRHWLWLLAQESYYEGVWSTFIVNELVRIRVETALRHGVAREVYRQRINDLIHLLSDVLLVADYRKVAAAGSLGDPDDDPQVAAALAAGATIVVSLNERDFPKGREVRGIRFMTPQEFLAELVILHVAKRIP